MYSAPSSLQPYERASLQGMQERLLEITRNCRVSMHEPDEASLQASVFGNHLDNAFGDDPETNSREFTLRIHDTGNDRTEYFNLASLVALARMATVDQEEQRLLPRLLAAIERIERRVARVLQVNITMGDWGSAAHSQGFLQGVSQVKDIIRLIVR